MRASTRTSAATSGLTTDAHRRAAAAAVAAAAKKAEDVVVLDVGDVLGIADLFVIASGTNRRQVKTIVEEVERALHERGVAPRSTEGLDDTSWVLLDYGDIVVHVFLDETRRYYDLERLWADAPRLDWAQFEAAV
ncbi:MAG: ribosome silencing factor [Acidimicrobiia bacterium]